MLSNQYRNVVNNQINEQGYTMKHTYHQIWYDKMSNRLKRIYNKNSQYPSGMVKTWSISVNPGFIVYSSNGEELVDASERDKFMFTIVRKSGLMKQDFIEATLASGKIIQYYGTVEYPQFECYITHKRLQIREPSSYLQNLDKFEISNYKSGPLNPFKNNNGIITLGNTTLLSLMPKYISSLSTQTIGIELFNSDGIVSDFAKPYLNKVRKVSIVEMYNVSKISSSDEVEDGDIYVEPIDFIMSDEEMTQNSIIISNLRKRGIKIKRESDVLKEVIIVIGNRLINYILS